MPIVAQGGPWDGTNEQNFGGTIEEDVDATGEGEFKGYQ